MPYAEVNDIRVSEKGEGEPLLVRGALGVVDPAAASGWDSHRVQATRPADRLRDEGKSAVFVGDREGVSGVIGVADTVRPSAPEVIAALKAEGIGRIVMLTGDNRRVADAIGAELGIAEVYADRLPEAKLRLIEELRMNGPVTMVGDGVNDAPALATARIGVAMGGTGTDGAWRRPTSC